MHDVEFVKLPQIWEETWPAMLKAKEQGKVRAIIFKSRKQPVRLPNCAVTKASISPKSALQFSSEHPDIASTEAGSANPDNIRKWDQWLAAPIDRGLLTRVREIFEPVKNIGHLEGLPENN